MNRGKVDDQRQDPPTLTRLLNASIAILPLVDHAREGYRRGIYSEFKAAIESEFRAAMDEAKCNYDRGLVDRVITESWDCGWEVTPFESRCALMAVTEFPESKILAIKLFRDQTNDGDSRPWIESPWRDGDGASLLTRSKEIIEVAQEVLASGI